MEIFIFILLFLSAELIITAVQFLTRKKTVSTGRRMLIALGKLILSVLLAFLPMAGPVQLRFLQPFMMASYAALFADSIADAGVTLYCRLRDRERRFSVVKAAGLLCGVLFCAYGVINMETVTPNHHTYTSEKLSTSHTLVFIADLHVGSAQPFSVTAKTLAEVRGLKPEATVLGGDIFDDYTTKQEMQETCRLFGEFETPVYYLYGNHDRQGHAQYAGGRKFTQQDLESALTENGVVILQDAYAEIAPDLLLLGREDISQGEGRAPIENLPDPAPEKYLIVADHQPSQFKENLASGADLQLSGHTHAGQLFPLGLLYDLIGYNYGDYQQGTAVMNVSAGACGWRVPFRTERHCHYEVIRLEPAAR